MLDILRFVFSGFWTFAGTLFLLTVIGSGVAEIIKAFAMMVSAFRRGGPHGDH